MDGILYRRKSTKRPFSRDKNEILIESTRIESTAKICGYRRVRISLQLTAMTLCKMINERIYALKVIHTYIIVNISVVCG